jgi:hypothetical protein
MVAIKMTATNMDSLTVRRLAACGFPPAVPGMVDSAELRFTGDLGAFVGEAFI